MCCGVGSNVSMLEVMKRKGEDGTAGKEKGVGRGYEGWEDGRERNGRRRWGWEARSNELGKEVQVRKSCADWEAGAERRGLRLSLQCGAAAPPCSDDSRLLTVYCVRPSCRRAGRPVKTLAGAS